MISLTTNPMEFHELSDKQKLAVEKYFDFFKVFYRDKNYSYQELVKQVITNGVVKIFDYEEQIKNFLWKAVENKTLPLIILTHPFVVNAIRIPAFECEMKRKFLYDFSIFSDLYGVELVSELSRSLNNSYELKRLYRSISTWDDILWRIGVMTMRDENSGLTNLDGFYNEMLAHNEFPIIWFFPEGVSRGLERNGKFKKGIFYLLKKIEEDRQLLKKFNCARVSVGFVDQYNTEITDDGIKCKLKFLHEFSANEIAKSIHKFSYGTDLLVQLINDYRQEAKSVTWVEKKI